MRSIKTLRRILPAACREWRSSYNFLRLEPFLYFAVSMLLLAMKCWPTLCPSSLPWLQDDFGHVDCVGLVVRDHAVCGMTVDPHTAAPRRARRQALLLLLRRVPIEVHGRPAALRTAPARRRRPSRCPKEQFSARCIPRSARSARLLPDLRHGAGAGARDGGGGAEPRARRHDAPVLDRARADLPVVALEMGGHLTGLDRLVPAQLELGPARARDRRSCSGPDGRSSCAAGSRS